MAIISKTFSCEGDLRITLRGGNGAIGVVGGIGAVGPTGQKGNNQSQGNKIQLEVDNIALVNGSNGGNCAKGRRAIRGIKALTVMAEQAVMRE